MPAAAPDAEDQPLAELIGHHIEISTSCQCTKVSVFSPEYLISRLGPGATLRIARSRLRCQTCRQRPALTLARDYATSEGRDMRVNPPAPPEWALPLLRR